VTFLFFFFFQAEDGIRDYKVTGVQTCAFRSQSAPAILPGRRRWSLQIHLRAGKPGGLLASALLPGIPPAPVNGAELRLHGREWWSERRREACRWERPGGQPPIPQSWLLSARVWPCSGPARFSAGAPCTVRQTWAESHAEDRGAT